MKTKVMKTTLGTEQLEDRRTLSSWSVEVLDTRNLVSPQVENQMFMAAHHVMWDLHRYLQWKGKLDLRIDVQPNDPNGADGIAFAITSTMWGNKNAAIHEMRTGVDPLPNEPDIGMVIQLGRDGTVRFYGMKAYFDPEPAPFVPANVPVGHIDFIGVLNHEVAHGIGFNWTVEFNRYVTTDSKGFRYFNGPNTVRLLGQPLPLTTDYSTHYHNRFLPSNPINSGLMFEGGLYTGNRLDWGKLDFAVLRDVGLSPNNLDGLPLTDKMDFRMPRLAVDSSAINENRPAGTVVTTLSTTYGSSNYTFRLCPVADFARFKIVGNTLVTTQSFDFESRNLYRLWVSMIDKDGVRTDSLLKISVKDVYEPPVTVVRAVTFPKSTTVVNALPKTTFAALALPTPAAASPTMKLPAVRVGGDANRRCSIVITSSTGGLWYGGTDRNIQVAYPNGKSRQNPGTVITLSGRVGDLNNNFNSIFYRGRDTQVTVKLMCIGRACSSSAVLRLQRA